MSVGREERNLQAVGDLGLRSQTGVRLTVCQVRQVEDLGGVGRLLEDACPAGEEPGGGRQVRRFIPFLDFEPQITGLKSQKIFTFLQASLWWGCLAEVWMWKCRGPP